MATFPKPAIPVLNLGSFAIESLEAAFPMAEGSGSALQDLSGNGHTATLQGTEGVDFSWETDAQMGTVVRLNGSSGFMTLAASLLTAMNGAGGATLTAWLKLDSGTPAAGQQGLMNLDGVSGAATAMRWPDGSNQAVWNALNDNDSFTDTLPVVDLSQWHLLAISKLTSSTYNLYLNGDLVASHAGEATGVVIDSPGELGRSTDLSGSIYFDGLWGDFRIWRRALEQPEIKSIYNNPWGMFILTKPPGMVTDFRVDIDYQPLHSSRARLSEYVGSYDLAYRSGGLASASKFLISADVGYDAGPLDPPPVVAQGRDFRLKPGRTPAPMLNSDPINTGTLLAMPFNDDTLSSTTQPDYGPNGHTAAVDASTWHTRGTADVLVDRVTRVAIDGNGGTAPATVPRAASLEPATEITLAAWVTPDVASGSMAVVAKEESTNGSYSWFLGTFNNGLRFILTDDIDGVADLQALNTFSAGERFHLAATYNGAIMRIYKNGVEVGNLANSGNILYDIAEDVTIGHAGAGNIINGAIENVDIWSRALSAPEIAVLVSNPWGRYCDQGMVTDFRVDVDYQPLYAAAARANEFIGAADLAFKGGGMASATEFIGSADFVPGVVNAAGLTIFSITPRTGPSAGGQLVTIRGRNFRDITQVLVGGLALTGLTVLDAGTIQGTTGNHLPGTVSVRVDSSTLGYVEADGAYVFTGGFGPASDQLIQGKQIDGAKFFRQEAFTGETAVQGVDTTLSFQLTDVPISEDAVELFLRKSGDGGGSLRRQGPAFDYTVDLGTRRITWKGTALTDIDPADEILIIYLGRGEF